MEAGTSKTYLAVIAGVLRDVEDAVDRDEIGVEDLIHFELREEKEV